MSSTNYFEDYYLEMGYFDVDEEIYVADGYELAGYAEGDSGLTQYVGGSGMGIPSAAVVMSPAVLVGVGRLGDLTFRQPPAGTELVFGHADESTTGEQTVSVSGFTTLVSPVHTIRLSHRFIYAGIGDLGAFSTQSSLRNWRTYARPSGVALSAAGTPSLQLQDRAVKPSGVSTLALGTQTIQLLKRYVTPSGFTTLGWGSASLVLHNRALYPSGVDLLVAKTTARVEYFVRTLTATGWSGQALGSPTLKSGNVELPIVGFSATVFGTQAIEVVKRYITPSSLPTTMAVGAPALELQNRNLYPSGKSLLETGWQTIDNREKFVKPAVISILAFGAATIAYVVRHVYPSGANVLAGGVPWVSDSPRYVEVGEGPKTSAYGTPTMGFGRQITPAGWTDEKFGTRITPVSQICYPRGMSGVFGEVRIENLNQTLAAYGFLSVGSEEFRWGSPLAWNLRQIVALYALPDTETGMVPPAMSRYARIENRNRVTTVLPATAPPRLPEPTIFNNARLVKPAGVQALTMQAVLQITHYVRRFTVDGVDVLHFDKYLYVSNAASVFKPAGIGLQAFGTAGVVNTRRTFRIYSYLNSLAVGTPMIAFRIRTIKIRDTQSIAPPTLLLPEVKQWRRYVAPTGFDTFADNLPYLRIHWNIFSPGGIRAVAYGSPAIKNRTPQYYPYGDDSFVSGKPAIRTRWRRYTLDGLPSQAFGKPVIADRRLWIYPNGVDKLLVGSKARVQKLTEDPPVDQKVYVPAISSLQMGNAPKTNILSAYPGGVALLGMGGPTIYSNGLQVDPGIGAFGYGTPTVSLWIRTLTPGSIGHSPEFDTSNYPRLSPWTIWAPSGAPQQALEWGKAGAYIDVGGDPKNPGIKLGSPTVTNRHRTLQTNSVGETSACGTPGLILRKRYINPAGYAPSRQGFHMIGPFTQTAEQQGDDVETPDTTYGEPTVTIHYTGPQTIAGQGFDLRRMGALDIENFNRRVYPTSWDSAHLSESSGNDSNPYEWQTLHVGPLMPTVPKGWDSQSFGTAWASLKIRDVRATGFDAFTSDYTLDAFDSRLKVKQAAVVIASQRTVTKGFTTMVVATPEIKLKTQYIRPDGNAETYRKGAPLS